MSEKSIIVGSLVAVHWMEAAMIWLLEASVTTIHQLSVQKDNMQELRRVARAQHTQVDSDLFDFEF